MIGDVCLMVTKLTIDQMVIGNVRVLQDENQVIQHSPMMQVSLVEPCQSLSYRDLRQLVGGDLSTH